jgi:hypothetical protein
MTQSYDSISVLSDVSGKPGVIHNDERFKEPAGLLLQGLAKPENRIKTVAACDERMDETSERVIAFS